MQPISIVAFFCEDIREEQDGILTIIGILPDNINIKPQTDPDISATAKDLSKLSAYLRMHFDPDEEFGEGTIRLVLPDEAVRDLGIISVEMANKARQKAKEKGNPLAGVMSRISLRGFTPAKLGRLKLEVILDGKTYIAGHLNLEAASEAEGTANSPIGP